MATATIRLNPKDLLRVLNLPYDTKISFVSLRSREIFCTLDVDVINNFMTPAIEIQISHPDIPEGSSEVIAEYKVVEATTFSRFVVPENTQYEHFVKLGETK